VKVVLLLLPIPVIITDSLPPLIAPYIPTYTALQRQFVYFKELDHQMNWTLVDMYGYIEAETGF
jgi:hypothetical protein